MRSFVALTGLALAGCGGNIVEPQPVNITGSDFCQIVDGKLTWDVKDTAPTIKGIRRLNAKWDSRCETRGRAVASK